MALRPHNDMNAKTVLRQTGAKVLFPGLFWLVFILMIIFMLLVIGGLCAFVEREALLRVVKLPEFRFAIRFTLGTTALATFLAALTAVPCGFILSRSTFPGKAIVDALLDVPIVLPPLVSGLALLVFFGPFLGKTLSELGWEVVFTPAGVVVAQWFIATPFAIKTFRQAFDDIDQRMENMARVLGYSPFGVFLHVTLPLARKGLSGGLVMAWARALGEFGATAMLAGITRMKTETLSVAIFLNMTVGDIQFAMITAVIMMAMAVALLATFKFISRLELRM